MSSLQSTPIHLALCGGGAGGFIGLVHRMAALMVGRFTLAAGLFSCDEGRARDRARAPLARRSPCCSGLTYPYAGYAMVREARARVAAGEIAAVRKLIVDYQQGWLAEPVEADDRQASWRTDPASDGGCIGDIGVHAFHSAEHVSGPRMRRLYADLSSVVPTSRLDDDGNVLLRFEGDVPGALTMSQVAIGEGNSLTLCANGAAR